MAYLLHTFKEMFLVVTLRQSKVGKDWIHRNKLGSGHEKVVLTCGEKGIDFRNISTLNLL